jgi:hypothetical protein
MQLFFTIVMKIAVCFSGQPRFISEYAPKIKEYLIDRYDTDVYGYLWWDDSLIGQPRHHEFHDVFENKNYIQEFMDTYQPKKLIQAKPIHIDLSNYYIGTYLPELQLLTPEDIIGIFTRYNSQWYSVKKAYEMIENPEQYDFIVRIRTDIALTQPIVLENLCQELLYLQNGYMTGADRHFGDYFAVGAPQWMKQYMSIYDLIYKYWTNGLIHTHTFIQEAMKELQLPAIPYEFGVKLDHSKYKYRK